MTVVKVMSWNHERATQPLAAGIALAEATSPHRYQTETRSLSDFEEFPVSTLANSYDLIMIDHPFVGTACELGVFLPASDLVPLLVDELEADSIGPSWTSYSMAGKSWAMPIDAACQVSAYRESTPVIVNYWHELKHAVDSGVRMVLPAAPVHLLSSIYSHGHQQVSSTLGRTAVLEDWWDASGPDEEVLLQAIVAVQEILEVCSPRSAVLDPIGALEAMAAGEFEYAPLIFGYVPYSHEGFRGERILFTDAPGVSEHRGTLLGGVGLAVSASAKNIAGALHLARVMTSDEFQSGPCVQNMGQPSRTSAWMDPAANALTAGFFTETVSTMQQSFVRPRFPGYPKFQKRTAERVHASMFGGHDHAAAVREIRADYQESVSHDS
jgi:multiple sugar transport system substrate-binding protein